LSDLTEPHLYGCTISTASHLGHPMAPRATASHLLIHHHLLVSLFLIDPSYSCTSCTAVLVRLRSFFCGARSLSPTYGTAYCPPATEPVRTCGSSSKLDPRPHYSRRTTVQLYSCSAEAQRRSDQKTSSCSFVGHSRGRSRSASLGTSQPASPAAQQAGSAQQQWPASISSSSSSHNKQQQQQPPARTPSKQLVP
jgi:hypothetical protein